MKNKLFYFLYLLYFVMVFLILYINGVFTGRVDSMSNLVINLVFLLVIGILFLISGVSFIRLNRCTDALVSVTDAIYKEYDSGSRNLWEIYRVKKKVFDNEVLDEAFYLYQKRMQGYQTKRGLTGTCSLEEYINEELLDRISLSYFNAAISGTMTGLGILGTFVGLSIGLGSFSGDDIYTISDNVGPLLGGMKVAFHTSVYGIFFSMVFNFVYRSIMSDAYDKLGDFLDCYRECVEPVAAGGDDSAKVMLIYQANMANSLKNMTELLKGQALEQSEALQRVVDRFTDQLSQTMGADFEKLGRTLQKAVSSQELYAKNYQILSDTTKDLLSANLTMQRTLEELMGRQEALSKELKAQEARISQTCDTINEEVSNQLYNLVQMKS